jgi:hypothetical protein
VKSVPAGYRFPFLDWLRALELEFSIDPQALQTRVTLEVESGGAGGPPAGSGTGGGPLR